MNYFSFYKDGKALYCLIFIGMMLSFPSVSAKILKRSYQTFPQKHSIQGTVTDGSAPLPGVTIAVKSKPLINTITDYNGHYTITAAPNDTLVVSFIGFKKTKVDFVFLEAIKWLLQSPNGHPLPLRQQSGKPALPSLGP